MAEPVAITTEVLDALNLGRHDLVAVQRVRRIFEAAGLPVRPHQLEIAEVARLRDMAAGIARDADDMEGSWPAGWSR